MLSESVITFESVEQPMRVCYHADKEINYKSNPPDEEDFRQAILQERHYVLEILFKIQLERIHSNTWRKYLLKFDQVRAVDKVDVEKIPV